MCFACECIIELHTTVGVGNKCWHEDVSIALDLGITRNSTMRISASLQYL